MFPNEMKRRLKETLIEIGLTTQLHGIPKIFNNKHKLLKILWLICFILSVSMCINYLIQTINGYLKYPVITNIITIQQNPMPMPVITVCDLNKLLTNYTVKDKIIKEIKKKIFSLLVYVAYVVVTLIFFLIRTTIRKKCQILVFLIIFSISKTKKLSYFLEWPTETNNISFLLDEHQKNIDWAVLNYISNILKDTYILRYKRFSHDILVEN